MSIDQHGVRPPQLSRHDTPCDASAPRRASNAHARTQHTAIDTLISLSAHNGQPLATGGSQYKKLQDFINLVRAQCLAGGSLPAAFDCGGGDASRLSKFDVEPAMPAMAT